MANKRKITTAVVASVVAVALLLGGTFAWQSINQTALNEASDVINPGGRLHDDFDGSNKDVYVENFADEPIFARIQLSEYFEIVLNYNTAGVKTENIIGSKTQKTDAEGNPVFDAEGNPVYEYTYVPYIFGTPNEDGTFNAAVGKDGTSYWDWTFGGSTTFMPTFNKNKDSLAADINGIYEEGNVGVISNRDGTQYTEYTEYTDGETKDANAIYDIDANTADELTDASVNVSDLIDGSVTADGYTDNVTLVSETHTAKETGNGELISMADWLAEVEADGGYDPVLHGNYWVYDTDGWVYWSAPIAPGEATGLLLDSIELSDVMDDTWYYAINVVAQFVTAGDTGSVEDGTGFYDTENGSAPSADAETLLAAINVDATFELTVTTAAVNFTNAAYTTGIDLGLSATMNITSAASAAAYASADEPKEVDLSAVTFTVANSTDADTKVENGKLFIGEDETATTITLNAQYGAYTSSVDISVDYFSLACWLKDSHFEPKNMKVLGEDNNNTYPDTMGYTVLCQIYTHDDELLNLGEEAYAFAGDGTHAYTSLETANTDDDAANDGHAYVWIWLPYNYGNKLDQVQVTVTWEGRTETFTFMCN